MDWLGTGADGPVKDQGNVDTYNSFKKTGAVNCVMARVCFETSKTRDYTLSSLS